MQEEDDEREKEEREERRGSGGTVEFSGHVNAPAPTFGIDVGLAHAGVIVKTEALAAKGNQAREREREGKWRTPSRSEMRVNKSLQCKIRTPAKLTRLREPERTHALRMWTHYSLITTNRTRVGIADSGYC